MPPDQSIPSQAEVDTTPQSPFMNILIPVLTAIGTGIGVLGFVIFFGGFILWTRFEAAGLPGNEAVAQVPRSDLVATGASFLVPAILAALAPAVIAVTSWDAAIGSSRRSRREQAEDERLRATEILVGLEKEKTQLEQRIEGCRDRAKQHRELAEKASEGSEERKNASKAEEAAEAEADKCKKRLEELTEKEIPAQQAAQKKAAEAIEHKPTRRNRGEQALQILLGFIPMVVALAIVVAAGWGGLTDGYRWLLIGVVLAALGVAVMVISMTDHFAWYLVCVFLGVGLTIAFSTYARTHSHAKVSPVAALSGPSPVVGFFVAETSEAVYVGKPEPAKTKEEADSLGFDPEGVTLMRVPKDKLTGLAIGPIMDEDDAYRRSLELNLELCRQADAAAKDASRKPKKDEAPASAAPPAICSKSETLLLEDRLDKAP